MNGRTFLIGVAGLVLIGVGIHYDIFLPVMAGGFIVGFVLGKSA